MSAISKAEWGLNGAVQEPRCYGGERPWPGWRFYFLTDTSIIAMDRLE
jgi:hypothetical protein